MQFDDKLDMLVRRHAELRDAMASPDAGSDFAKFSKEFSDLSPIIEKVEGLKKAQAELRDLKEMIADPDADAEMKGMAQDELREAEQRIPEMTKEVQIALLPKDEADEKNAIIEVRAGTGGDEAGLFAAELFRMYQRYSDLQGWRFEILSISDTGIGGYKEATGNYHRAQCVRAAEI